MLRRATRGACRCTSTSTSLVPCRHSSSSSTVTPTRATTEWFQPFERTSFRSQWWSLPPTPTRPTLVTRTTKTTDKTRIDDEQEQERVDAESLLLSRYLSDRGSRESLDRYRKSYPTLLQIARERRLAFVEALVIEDVEWSNLSNRERNRLELDRFYRHPNIMKRDDDEMPRGKEEPKALLTEVVDFPKTSTMSTTTTSRTATRRRLRRRLKAKSKVHDDEANNDSSIAGTLNLAQAIETLDDISNLNDPLAAAAAASRRRYTLEQLEQTWKTFRDGCDLDESLRDYTLALEFLLHLVVVDDPPPPRQVAAAAVVTTTVVNDDDGNESLLPLALQVFRSLIQVLPEEVIATTSISMSGRKGRGDVEEDGDEKEEEEEELKRVMLETIVKGAIDQDLWQLGSKSLLHLVHHAKENGDKEEEEHEGLIETISMGWLHQLEVERKTRYRPDKLLSSLTSTTTTTHGGDDDKNVIVARNEEGGDLDRVFQLLRTYFDVTAREAKGGGGGGAIDTTTTRRRWRRMVETFSRECSERYRWDLVADLMTMTMTTTTPPSPSTTTTTFSLEPKYHVKFARWLAGEAPFSTYPPRRRRERPVRQDVFESFVRMTHDRLVVRPTPTDRGGGGLLLSDSWTTDDKYDWLDLLTTSRASNGHTRSIARHVAHHWSFERYPLTTGGTRPFVMRSSTLLNLIRTSLPPFASSSKEKEEEGVDDQQGKSRNNNEKMKDLLKSLINHSIKALVSPQSPYYSATTTRGGGGVGGVSLSHFDLTTLAQSYALLGDQDSVAQVYRKLLHDERYIPDAKDVSIVLTSGSSQQQPAPASSLSRTRHGQGNSSLATLDLGGGGGRRRRQGQGATTFSSTRTRTRMVELLNQTHEMGLEIGQGLYKDLLRQVMDREIIRRRRRQQGGGGGGGTRRVDGEEEGWKQDVQEILEFARSSSSSTTNNAKTTSNRVVVGGVDVEKLENYVLGSTRLFEPRWFDRLSDERLINVVVENPPRRGGGGGVDYSIALAWVRRCHSLKDYRFSSRIYLAIVRHLEQQQTGILNDDDDDEVVRVVGTMLNQVLTTLLSTYSTRSTRPTDPSRRSILEHFKLVVDRTLTSSLPSSLLNNMFNFRDEEGGGFSNLEWCLKAMIKVGDVDAVERLLDAVGEGERGGGGVSRSIKETVVRWSISQHKKQRRGRLEVTGHVARWAKELDVRL
ncbi:hypothetical protein JCM3766R1_002689 [Sporobolomyces carnicolor]